MSLRLPTTPSITLPPNTVFRPGRSNIIEWGGEHIAGIQRPGDVELSFITTDEVSLRSKLIDELFAGRASNYEVRVGDQTMRFKGFVTNVQDNALGDTTAVIKPTGPIEPVMKEKPMPKKIRNRFYVASPNVTKASEQDQPNVEGEVALAVDSRDVAGRMKWTRNTLKDALAHAETILERNPNQDHVAVAQIIRVVRRRKAPVIVETVK